MMIKSLPAAGAAFLILAAGVVWLAANLLRSNRAAGVVSARLAPAQEITIPSAGDLVVLIEAPRFGGDYRGLQIEVVEKETGRVSSLKYALVGAQAAVRGVTTIKVPFGRMSAPSAGVYSVRVAGLAADHDYSGYRLIFSRPYLGRMIFQIAGIVICAVGMLLSLIWAAWSAGWIKPDPASSAPMPQPTSNVPGKTVDLETWKRQQSQPPK